MNALLQILQYAGLVIGAVLEMTRAAAASPETPSLEEFRRRLEDDLLARGDELTAQAVAAARLREDAAADVAFKG